ncbi:hypothetical protein FB459_1978 [Yimella lutea]|uniref:DUF7455 domain-containing protein n=1 Tax=Yimella lutea TaxID=587872 RepID=A0A542EGP7_9MICO|nr:hypothetical protein [Yimella lutea]TQJ14511.1 hypothetical protein FB459_1978 [Yimella lutea]
MSSDNLTTCDECGVRARTDVTNSSGTVLSFCGHHYRARCAALVEAGWWPAVLAHRDVDQDSSAPTGTDDAEPLYGIDDTQPIPVGTPSEPKHGQRTRTVFPIGEGLEQVQYTDEQGRLSNCADGTAAVTIRSIATPGQSPVVYELRRFRAGVWTDEAGQPALIRFDTLQRPRVVVHALAGQVTDIIDATTGAVAAYAVVHLDERGEATLIESWAAGHHLQNMPIQST